MSNQNNQFEYIVKQTNTDKVTTFNDVKPLEEMSMKEFKDMIAVKEGISPNSIYFVRYM